MNDLLIFLAAPVVIAFLMVGIHAYLGLHVIEREVVFVDIGLAQIAVVGALISQFFAHEHNKIIAYASSLGLCLLVSFFLAYFRKSQKNISQEILVGIIYAFASGLTVLMTDKMAHGVEHLKHALIGNILFVTWDSVLITAIVYSLVGAVHWIYRKELWRATRGKTSHLFWDFLFYALFSVVITVSTMHAGVLVVFAILMAPAAFARTRYKTHPQQLLLAWCFGFVGILISFFMSTVYDLPAGATITTLLSLGFLTSFLWRNKTLNNQ